MWTIIWKSVTGEIRESPVFAESNQDAEEILCLSHPVQEIIATEGEKVEFNTKEIR